MSLLSTALKDYLSLRTSLGYKLENHRRDLPKFVSLLDRHGVLSITTKLALQWAAEPQSATQAYRAQRLVMVRGFAKYLSGIDRRTEIPPPRVLPDRYQRRKPHIYVRDEIRQLLKATAATKSTTLIRAKTYATVFGLLAATGVRLGECLNLDDPDVDVAECVLMIRGSKWRKSRLVPIHPTTASKLAAYRRLRNQLHPKRPTPAFFVSNDCDRPTKLSAQIEFLRVARRIGLRGPPGTKGPHLHDLRHTFAVRTLLGWYRAGIDVECHLPELSTYLGHSSIASTYWYFSAEPELLQLAAMRLAKLKGVKSHENPH